MSRPATHGGPAKWLAAGVTFLLLASVVAFVSMAGGQQPSASSHGASRGNSPAASPLPAQDALDVSQTATAATAAVPAVVAPAVAAPEAASAAPGDLACPDGSVCNWPGPNGTGHKYIDTSTFSCFGPATVGSFSNNSDSDIAYVFDNATCQGGPVATVQPGDSDPNITPAGTGFAIVDPAGSGSLDTCSADDNLCWWEMGGYLGTMTVQADPVGCLTNTPASMANTSSDLVAYVYNTDDCSGPAATIDPDSSVGDLVDAFGDISPQSMQVVKLANPAIPSPKPLAFAVVGTDAFITFPDWDTCIDSPASACFEYADDSVEGEIAPTQLASLATSGFLPAADLDEILADLPLVGDGSDGCTSIPALGSSPLIIAVFDNTSDQFVLGAGNCSEVEGADETAGTDQAAAPHGGAVLAPVDAAGGFDFGKCLTSAQARNSGIGSSNYCIVEASRLAPKKPAPKPPPGGFFDFGKCLTSAQARNSGIGSSNYCIVEAARLAPPSQPPTAKNTQRSCIARFEYDMIYGRAFSPEKLGVKICPGT